MDAKPLNQALIQTANDIAQSDQNTAIGYQGFHQWLIEKYMLHPLKTRIDMDEELDLYYRETGFDLKK